MPEPQYTNSIDIAGARVHNLKNIDLHIPREKLVVLTGLSGSGKSSLAFDTIYAEGQRRYIETFSAYARQFLGNLERPDVDDISGLSPVIAIEQKTINRSPRSTVGTITEIYDFLRLLFARIGEAYSYKTGEKMVRYSEEQLQKLVLDSYHNRKISILAPVVRGRKGHYRELFESILKQGYLRARVDGEVRDLSDKIKLDRYKIHDIEIVVDRLLVNQSDATRISRSINTALELGNGVMMVLDMETNEVKHLSKDLMCPTTGISYPLPEPNLFSFNSPYGVCKHCNGLGTVTEVDPDKIIPDKKLNIKKGGIAPLGTYKNNWIFRQVEALLKKYGHTLSTPVKDLDPELIQKLLFGTDETLRVSTMTGESSYNTNYEGIISFISRQALDSSSKEIQRWANSFTNLVECPICHGTRLRQEALFFKLNQKNIAEFAALDIQDFYNLIGELPTHLSERQNTIASEILKEIRSRTGFLLDVGLNYLTLNRGSRTLSGGEAQRIRLATQIGSDLVGVLYILDEPSIGLHQRDNQRLINSLYKLRDKGNSVIVVEHDKDMMLAADCLIDLGPGAGLNGGKIVATGSGGEFAKNSGLTAAYLAGTKKIEVPKTRRKGNGKKLILKGASGNNLKNIKVEFPLGRFICVTGVSGSGKSSLINQTLYPLLNRHFYKSVLEPLPFEKIEGLENLDKVIEIDQSPIGRTPRSNPATYTGVFTDIRNLFALLPEAKIRGYSPGRFSFNTKGGRCEVCLGAGLRTIEMNFLPDVYVTCEACNGKRYNRETLQVRYRGKSISDVLNMSMETAVEFFADYPKINRKLKTLVDVGLGYITLGQQSTTLSGGEAQRVKLAGELARRDTGNTFYILDEPSTGLHFEDIRMLLNILDRLVDNGNTVLVIEHNLDIIKVADYVIDIGPEGGSGGGNLVIAGTPEKVAKSGKGYTAGFLKQELDQK